MIVKKLLERGGLFGPPETQKLKSGLVMLKKGEEVGEHVTEGTEEIILVLKGIATIYCEGKEQTVEAGCMAVFIPEGKKHNVRNNYYTLLEYVYIVTPV